MKQKTFFIVFKGLSFGEKNKKLIKIADTSFKKRTNKTQYVETSEAFHKIYLLHQALYKTNNVTEFINATKLRIKN